MADAGPYPKLQRLEDLQNNAKASKFYYHFLYKAIIVSVFLVIGPLLSSQAPDFVNQNFHSRSWELLQLIFVGIAVSYGLFSKRSEDSEKEKESSSTFDNAHSYISRLLQVSSVFDDETENPSAFDENNKIQTWNSQYYRGEPMVVVAKEDSVHQEQMKTSSLIGEKPLLLPIRSLKSRVSEAHLAEPIQTGSVRRSVSGPDWFSNNADKSMSPLNFQEDLDQNAVKRSGSKRFSSKGKQSRNQESGGAIPPTMEETGTSVVHRSPIPWRSRSGRMVFKEDIDGSSLQNSVEDSESNRHSSNSFRSLSSSQSRIDSHPQSPNKQASSPLVTSPRKLSPSPSRSGEPQQKRIEDFVRKKNFNKSSPPPPPPPPPPPYHHKPSLLSSGSRGINDGISVTRELRRSVRSVPMEFNDMKRLEVPRRVNSSSEFMATADQHDGSNIRTVRTTRQRETFGKTMRSNEFGAEFGTEEEEKWSKAIEETFGNKKEFANGMVNEKFPSASRQTFLEVPEQEESESEDDFFDGNIGKEEFMEKGVVHPEEETDTESEDDFFDGNIGKEEVSFNKDQRVDKEVEVGATEDSNVDGGPDVDKKADEFIAKFREQIRLQRLQSIRRSSTQYPGNHSR